MTKRNIRKTAQKARELRKHITGPEKALWYVLRNRGLAGMKFRRQHPIDPYIVDFYASEEKLVVELDGASHDEKNVGYDLYRQRQLESMGLKVLRVSNDDVLYRIDDVVNAILKACGRQIEPGERVDE